jgi:TfoX/Sxy family transcriptional regulator of competence genes
VPVAEDRWQALVAEAEGGPVSRGSMFGSQGLRTGKKFFAIRWHDKLVVKLPRDRLTELVGAGDAQPFEPMEGRAMNGWVVVDDAVDWGPLTAEARAFVESQAK